MTKAEMTALIGELISTEIDDVHQIEYINELSFSIIMENRKRFNVDVKNK